MAWAARTDQAILPFAGIGTGLMGMLFGFWKDRQELIHYGIENGQLLLKRGQVVERIDLDTVQDASLVDHRAARDLLTERERLMEELGRIPAEREEFKRQSTRWCTADIGLGLFRSGWSLMDRRPDGKYDLVLLRMKDGGTLLLSPVYNQDLISALNKSKGAEDRRQQRA